MIEDMCFNTGLGHVCCWKFMVDNVVEPS